MNSIVVGVNTSHHVSDSDVVVLNDEGELNCTPRSIEEFPENYFTLEQRQNGWVAVRQLQRTFYFS